MYLKKCRCGKSEKNFKFDIGPFFINKCCKEAGFDVHGNRAEPEAKAAPKEEAPKSMIEKAVEVVAPKKKAPAKKKASSRKKKAASKEAPKSEESSDSKE